jgi:hypothetical protein
MNGKKQGGATVRKLQHNDLVKWFAYEYHGTPIYKTGRVFSTAYYCEVNHRTTGRPCVTVKLANRMTRTLGLDQILAGNGKAVRFVV